nr:MAG TPA: Protein of unknown function (DUF1642) [Caudoviricetes sp.]
MDDCTKVLVYGSFDGFVYSTDDSLSISVVLDSGEKVEIPEEFIVSADQMVNKNKIRLKDVIERIEKFDIGTKAVWINEILNKLGSEYGFHKYCAGYKQGKFDGTIEREKVTVPQFAGDFIAEQKKLGHMLSYSIDACMSDRVAEWYWDNSLLFVRALLDGYEVEQEKRYTVKLKNTDDYLVKTAANGYHFYNNIYTQNRKHTKEEIEKSGFGWVFDCKGIEVEKVEE